MPFIPFKSQKGAALAFSLVMLLLLTLVSTSMIKQNKVQIDLATNTGLRVTAFSSVETALRNTLTVLNSKRYGATVVPSATSAAGKANFHCKSGAANQLYTAPHTSATVVNDGTVTAVIQNEYCIVGYDAILGSGTEYQCVTNPSTGLRTLAVGDLVAADAGATPPVQAYPNTFNVGACDRLTNSGGWTANVGNPLACPIEVYTVHVKFLDSNSGSERTVETKFEIDCHNDAWNSPT